MAFEQPDVMSKGYAPSIPVNKVVRNTFMLLSLALAFGALTATVSMMMGMERMNIFVFFIGAFGLMFLVNKFQNSGLGLVLAFVFTGFMGLSIGPVVSSYMALPGGGQTVASALGSTAIIFLALSGYALVSKKDFSFLSGFLFAGFIILMGAVVVGLFTQIPGLQLAISAGFALFACAAILYETSAIVNGGQQNYIAATVSLYLSIYNLFLSLLHLFGVLGDD
jgi:modulator of FtsH protease